MKILSIFISVFSLAKLFCGNQGKVFAAALAFFDDNQF